MKYYAFEYWSGRNTTIGQPNKITGRLSIAGDLRCFDTMAERDGWIKYFNRGRLREKVTKRESRQLCAGMSVRDYEEYLQMLED
jgi:hypothetical protein